MSEASVLHASKSACRGGNGVVRECSVHDPTLHRRPTMSSPSWHGPTSEAAVPVPPHARLPHLGRSPSHPSLAKWCPRAGSHRPLRPPAKRHPPRELAIATLPSGCVHSSTPHNFGCSTPLRCSSASPHFRARQLADDHRGQLPHRTPARPTRQLHVAAFIAQLRAPLDPRANTLIPHFRGWHPGTHVQPSFAISWPARARLTLSSSPSGVTVP